MNLVNEAALLAARRGKRIVTMHEFEDAKDKVMMGAERRTLVMTDDEKRLTAYHEAGHAIVALNVPATDPVHKATIIPRGRALGMVMQLPERDKLSMSFEQMTSRLAIMMGGRIAEDMTFGADKVTSGAQSDIDQATRLARMMVTRWGFSPELGTVAYGENQEEVFLGMSMGRTQSVSEATAQKIDSEVRRLVENGLVEARRILERQARRPRDAGAGAARIRDPLGRRDPRPPRRQAAGPRHRRAGNPAAPLPGPDRRPRPPPRRRARTGAGASAAGLRNPPPRRGGGDRAKHGGGGKATRALTARALPIRRSRARLIPRCALRHAHICRRHSSSPLWGGPKLGRRPSEKGGCRGIGLLVEAGRRDISRRGKRQAIHQASAPAADTAE